MEQRGILLRGIAQGLNAGGSALLNVYDAAISIKNVVLSGEKGKLRVQLREYEKKVQRLYYEIGKEIALREPSPATSAAEKVRIKLVAEYRAEIEKINQRIQDMDEGKKAAQEKARESAGARAEQATGDGEPAVSEELDFGAATPGPETEEAEEITVAPLETPGQELQEGVTVSEAPVAGEPVSGAEAEEKIEVVAEVATQQLPQDPVESEPQVAGERLSAAGTEETAEMVAEAAGTPEPKLPREAVESEAPGIGETASDRTEDDADASAAGLESLIKRDLLKICSEKEIGVDKRMTRAEIIELITKGKT